MTIRPQPRTVHTCVAHARRRGGLRLEPSARRLHRRCGRLQPLHGDCHRDSRRCRPHPEDDYRALRCAHCRARSRRQCVGASVSPCCDYDRDKRRGARNRPQHAGRRTGRGHDHGAHGRVGRRDGHRPERYHRDCSVHLPAVAPTAGTAAAAAIAASAVAAAIATATLPFLPSAQCKLLARLRHAFRNPPPPK